MIFKYETSRCRSITSDSIIDSAKSVKFEQTSQCTSNKSTQNSLLNECLLSCFFTQQMLKSPQYVLLLTVIVANYWRKQVLSFFFLEENLAAAITGKQNIYISGLYSSKKDVVLNEVRKSVLRYIRQTTGVG